MKYFSRLDDALMNTGKGETVALMSIDKQGTVKPLPSLYPVPATTDNGFAASNYLHLTLCPWTQRYGEPCQCCKDDFIDGLNG